MRRHTYSSDRLISLILFCVCAKACFFVFPYGDVTCVCAGVLSNIAIFKSAHIFFLLLLVSFFFSLLLSYFIYSPCRFRRHAERQRAYISFNKLVKSDIESRYLPDRFTCEKIQIPNQVESTIHVYTYIPKTNVIWGSKVDANVTTFVAVFGIWLNKMSKESSYSEVGNEKNAKIVEYTNTHTQKWKKEKTGSSICRFSHFSFPKWIGSRFFFSSFFASVHFPFTFWLSSSITVECTVMSKVKSHHFLRTHSLKICSEHLGKLVWS